MNWVPYMSSTPFAAALLALSLSLCCGFTPAAELFPLSCFYAAADSDEGLDVHANCARRDGETMRLAPEHLKRLVFDTEGLAGLSIDGASYYVNPQGVALKVLTFDNGPDYFSEGLVRAWGGDRVGYYDKHFTQVIAPDYDWGSPFENGRADVCRGCRRGPSDGDGHWAMEGGEWGTIDRSGKLIGPLRAPAKTPAIEFKP